MTGALLASASVSAQSFMDAGQIATVLGSTQAAFEKSHGRAKECAPQSGGAFCVYETVSGRFRIIYERGRAISVVWDVPEKQLRALTWSDVLPANACSAPASMPLRDNFEWDCTGGIRLNLSNNSRGMTWLVQLSYPAAIRATRKAALG